MSDTTKKFYQAIQRDLDNISNITCKTLSERDFYLPMLKIFLRYFIILSICNVSVALSLHFFSSYHYFRFPSAFSNLIFSNLFFAAGLVLITGQYHAFKLMAGHSLQSMPFINEMYQKFELIFFAIYVLTFTACLSGEGDSSHAISSAKIESIVGSVFMMALYLGFEAKRLSLPLLIDLIGKVQNKAKTSLLASLTKDRE